MSIQPNEGPTVDVPLEPRKLLKQLTVGIAVLLAVVVVAYKFLADPIHAASQAFVDRFGLLGIFVGVLVIDSTAGTHEPLLMMGFAGGLGFWPVVLVASVASVLAGIVGWTLGGFLGRRPEVQRWFQRTRVDAFLHRYGFWAVAVAATTPFPYSVSTWAAGAVGVPFRPLLLGALFRFPKVLFYASLVAGGMHLGANL